MESASIEYKIRNILNILLHGSKNLLLDGLDLNINVASVGWVDLTDFI